jgi:hydroxymethylpyrimidine/phosphomethylpyrimidine kinase
MVSKRILTIAGSDSGGGAGIQADLKTITALGGFGMSVITALTAQNTTGIKGILEIPAEFVGRQIDAVATDIGLDAAKTGMLMNADIINTVAVKISKYGIEKLVVDPVMTAKGGAMLMRDEAKDALIKELIPLAFVVTPNIPEAEVLAEMAIHSIDEMKQASQIIFRMGARHVVIKGGHLAGDPIDILFDGKDFCEFTTQRINMRDTHGTGCLYSAAIATYLAEGEDTDVPKAVKQAKTFITRAIRYGCRIGKGYGPANPFAPISAPDNIEAERRRCLEQLKSALQRLLDEKCASIIPEVQSNLGYAMPAAAGPHDIAAVPGRIVRVGDGVEIVREPAFGASRHAAGIISTVIKYNPEYRSAMNIRFSDEIIRACMALGYELDSFDRSEEPTEMKSKEGTSLQWGVQSVLKRRKTIPDGIFDYGDMGKEPMVRILGKSPDDVVDKVLAIARYIKS